MITYAALRHAHVVFVVISGTLFCYRFFRLQRRPDQPLHKALRIVPHINDTLLLGSAIGMLILVDINPVRVPWLLIKLVLLLVYIGLGAACLRAPAGGARQRVMFTLAAIVFTLIVVTALTKTVFFAF